MKIASSQQLFTLMVVELSLPGFEVFSRAHLPLGVWGEATIELGQAERSTIKAVAVRDKSNGLHGFYAFKLAEPDLPWLKFVSAMQSGTTHDDLENSTRFMPE